MGLDRPTGDDIRASALIETFNQRGVQTAIDDDKTKFPDLTQLNHVRQLNAGAVNMSLSAPGAPFILDVRNPEEIAI